MNKNNLYQIFNNYIANFDEINRVHEEYYKWQVAYKFKNLMDDALKASNEDFAKKLFAVKMLTENLIDSYTVPFAGLCKLAEIEPNIVRNMFIDLYGSDYDDLSLKREKINEFIEKSHALRDAYYPGSYLYTDDIHSVTGYLFLYDPDHNYFFKATHCRNFADCIAFVEDWGSMKDFDLKVFFKMCDWIREEIMLYPPLLEANEKHFDGRFGTEMHPDAMKHILVFDIIYCCTMANLFDGITFKKRSSKKEMEEYHLKQIKAQKLYEEIKTLQPQMDAINDFGRFVKDFVKIGDKVSHSDYGKGTITDIEKGLVTIAFDDEEEAMKFPLLDAIGGGAIQVDNDALNAFVETNQETIRNENDIRFKFKQYEAEFKIYKRYLDE